jgi:hypothetical protein
MVMNPNVRRISPMTPSLNEADVQTIRILSQSVVLLEREVQRGLIDWKQSEPKQGDALPSRSSEVWP